MRNTNRTPLARPVRGGGVPLRDVAVEFERDAAEGGLVADVGLAEAARGEPADARLGRNDNRNRFLMRRP